MRQVQTLWHTRALRMGCQRVRACRTLARRGVRHRGSSGTHWGATTQDNQASPPTGRASEHCRRKTRRRLCGTHESEQSGTDPQPTRRGQAEDHTKASRRTRAGAIGGGSAESFRCRRIFRLTSPCVMAAMIRNDPH